jgi:hypothetical protein
MNKPTLKDQLTALKRLCDQATPGESSAEEVFYGSAPFTKKDAAFYVTARTALPALIEALQLAIEQRNYLCKNDEDPEYHDAQLAAILTKASKP